MALPLPPSQEPPQNTTQTVKVPQGIAISHSNETLLETSPQKQSAYERPWDKVKSIFLGKAGSTMTTGSPAPAYPVTVQEPQHNRLIDLGQELEKVRRKTASGEWDKNKLSQKVVEYCEWAAQLQHKRFALLKELNAKTDECLDLQGRLLHQDQDVRKAQETAFALMASNVSSAEDDNVIRSKLKRIRARWKTFARDWALKNVDDIQDKGEFMKLFDNLVAPDEHNSEDGLWEEKNKGIAPAILLNAELARFIAAEIVTRPFTASFGLGTKPDDTPEDTLTMMRALETIYDLSKKGTHHKVILLVRCRVIDMTQMTKSLLTFGDHRPWDSLIRQIGIPVLWNHLRS